MSDSRAQHLQALFEAALDQPSAERVAFLEAACPDDLDLRHEVLSLLEADAVAEADDFLEDPALDVPDGATRSRSLIGQSIGPYTVLRMLGHGGMGEVYLAVRHTPFKQHVALKLIRQGLYRHDVVLRFEMERQILASLNHPHVAKLLDGGITEDGVSYLVMEYVRGEQITRYCDARRLTIKERLRLFISVCEAVHYAHQNLVVHRDLKPSNILVTDEGAVKLLDFGVAKLLNPSLSNIEAPVTRTFHRVMTPEYAAPEQVRGELVTTATDVYALGVLLYELLTGQRPYRLRGSSPVELEQVICLQEPERPSTRIERIDTGTLTNDTEKTRLASEISEARSVTTERLRRALKGDLDNIVLKALRKEMHLRYRSVEQLAEDLARYLEGMPVEARPSTVTYRVRKFMRRHRVAVAAALVMVLSLLGGLGLALWQAQVARAERDRAALALGQSEAVTGFLMDLFEASDPYQSAGDTLTSFELLEQGVERAMELSDEPEVQAQVLHTIGVVYERLEQHENAESLLRQALALRKDLLGPEHADVAATQNQLAWLLKKEGEYEAAEPLMREALAMRRKFLGDIHPDIAMSLNDLASLLSDKGDYDAAEPFYREALAMRRALVGEESRPVAISLNNLGVVLWEQGNYDEAEHYLRTSLAVWLKLFGPDHPETAHVTNNLARVLRDQGDYDTAETLFQDALARQRTMMGADHPRVASILFNVAVLHHQKGQYAAADSFYTQALSIQRARRGATHPTVAQSLNGLAALRMDEKNYPAAEHLYLEALSIQRVRFGQGHREVEQTKQSLAELYEAWGKTIQAAQYRTPVL